MIVRRGHQPDERAAEERDAQHEQDKDKELHAEHLVIKLPVARLSEFFEDGNLP